MPRVLMVKDKPETILSTRDFEDLINKHMGYECAGFYREQIEQLSDCVRDLSNYIADEGIKSEIEEVLQINGY